MAYFIGSWSPFSRVQTAAGDIASSVAANQNQSPRIELQLVHFPFAFSPISTNRRMASERSIFRP